MTDVAAEKRHALLSPSSAERWRNCPAAAAVAALYPPTSSEFSDEGTAAHELASWCLSENRDAVAYLGRIIEVPSRDGSKPRKFTVDETMADYVQGYVDRTRNWLKFDGAELFVEVELPIDSITGEKGATGTSDSVVLIPRLDSRGKPTTDVIVRDLKYGRGVQVGAKANSQLIIYAAAAVEFFSSLYPITDEATIRMEIDQPRREHLSTWSITLSDLRRDHVEQIKKDAKVALATPADAKRIPGDWCRFCPARSECETRAKWIADGLSEATSAAGFDVTATAAPLPPTGGPDRAKLAQNLARIERIREQIARAEDWCKHVEEDALAVLLTGEKVPGYKLVLGGEGHRKWSDEKAAEITLISHGAPRSKIFSEPALKSPAQCEKLIPKEARPLLVPLITRPAGKPTVVPESDSRPSVTATTSADGFTAAEDAASIL